MSTSLLKPRHATRSTGAAAPRLAVVAKSLGGIFSWSALALGTAPVLSSLELDARPGRVHAVDAQDRRGRVGAVPRDGWGSGSCLRPVGSLAGARQRSWDDKDSTGRTGRLDRRHHERSPHAIARRGERQLRRGVRRRLARPHSVPAEGPDADPPLDVAPLGRAGNACRSRHRLLHRAGTDRKLLADVWSPPDSVAPSGLGFIYLHGGGYSAFDKGGPTEPWFRHLAAQGHVVMDVSYRLIPETTVPGMQGDVKRALAWLKRKADRYGVNPDKIVLGGGSAGSHLALLAAYAPYHPLFTPEDVRGRISGARGHRLLQCGRLSTGKQRRSSCRLRLAGGPGRRRDMGDSARACAWSHRVLLAGSLARWSGSACSSVGMTRLMLSLTVRRITA